MTMADKKDHTDVLLEDMNSKFDFIVETVGSMQKDVKKIPEIAGKIEKLEQEVMAVKLATTATNRDVKQIKTHVEKIDKQLDEIEERLISVEARP